MSAISTPVQAEPAHSSNECAPSVQAAPTLDVTFRPGQKMGLKFDMQTGIVTEVVPESQADHAGVKAGCVMLKINADVFSPTEVNSRAWCLGRAWAKDCDFTVTFEKLAQPAPQDHPALLGQLAPHSVEEPRKEPCQGTGFSDGSSYSDLIIDVPMLPAKADYLLGGVNFLSVTRIMLEVFGVPLPKPYDVVQVPGLLPQQHRPTALAFSNLPLFL